MLLTVQKLVKHFPSAGPLFSKTKDWVRAVDGIDFTLDVGQTLALVGESGCGKTTTATLVLLLERPSSGRILFNGKDAAQMRSKEVRAYHESVQAVFQDPYSSLSPRMTVGSIISEPLQTNTSLSRSEIAKKVDETLELVELWPEAAKRYPHEFSGGQRQRIAVARSLVLNPKVIVLDEPVSALDVSIRAQLMNLLKDLQSKFNQAYLLIAHDLATVRYMSTYVAVMYLGQIVERADSEELFSRPQHPYTRALLEAALPVDPDKPRSKTTLPGDVASPIHPPQGCRFHPRCLAARQDCSKTEPVLRQAGANHWVACHGR